MRGISPIIAVVILLALVVTLGVMISIWVTGWLSEQRGSEEFGCATRTSYTVENARYVSSDSALRFRITNKGEEGLYGFGIVLLNDTNTVTIGYDAANITLSSAISETNKLKREESVYVTVDLTGTGNIGATLTQVTVKNNACKAVPGIAYYIRQE